MRVGLGVAVLLPPLTPPAGVQGKEEREEREWEEREGGGSPTLTHASLSVGALVSSSSAGVRVGGCTYMCIYNICRFYIMYYVQVMLEM